MAVIATKIPKERLPGPEPAGHICAEEGCDTRLSTYNCGDHCAQHGGWPKDEATAMEQRDAFAEVMAA